MAARVAVRRVRSAKVTADMFGDDRCLLGAMISERNRTQRFIRKNSHLARSRGQDPKRTVRINLPMDSP
jgi:hypothetical protein